MECKEYIGKYKSYFLNSLRKDDTNTLILLTIISLCKLLKSNKVGTDYTYYFINTDTPKLYKNEEIIEIIYRFLELEDIEDLVGIKQRDKTCQKIIKKAEKFLLNLTSDWIAELKFE